MGDRSGVQLLVLETDLGQPYLGSTHPVNPSVGRRNEYQSKGAGALRLRSKGRYGSCVGGR